MLPNDAEQLLLKATGRSDLQDALEWFTDARAMPNPPATHLLLQALTMLSHSGEHAELADRALKLYARPALRSRLDPSTELLLVDTLTAPAIYKESLDIEWDFMTSSRSGTMGADPDVLDALERAGIPFNFHPPAG